MTRKECYEIFEFDDNIILTEQKIENKYEELFNANSSAKKLKLIDEAYVTLMNRSFSDSNCNTDEIEYYKNIVKEMQKKIDFEDERSKKYIEKAIYYQNEYNKLNKEREERNKSVFCKIKERLINETWIGEQILIKKEEKNRRKEMFANVTRKEIREFKKKEKMIKQINNEIAFTEKLSKVSRILYLVTAIASVIALICTLLGIFDMPVIGIMIFVFSLLLTALFEKIYKYLNNDIVKLRQKKYLI